MGDWNWLDWTLAAVVLVSVLTAFQKGFVRELIALAALIAGLIIATLEYERASVWFDDLTRSHQAAQGLAFLTLFLGTLLVGAVISGIAGKLIKQAGIQKFDRFVGALFGLVRGVAFDCVLLLVMLAFAIKVEAVRRSVLAPYMIAGAEVVAKPMPADLKAHFREGVQKFRSLGQTDTGTKK